MVKSKCYLCKRNVTETFDVGYMKLYCSDCVKAVKTYFTDTTLSYKQLVIYGIYRRKNKMNYDVRKKVWERLQKGDF